MALLICSQISARRSCVNYSTNCISSFTLLNSARLARLNFLNFLEGGMQQAGLIILRRPGPLINQSR